MRSSIDEAHATFLGIYPESASSLSRVPSYDDTRSYRSLESGTTDCDPDETISLNKFGYYDDEYDDDEDDFFKSYRLQVPPPPPQQSLLQRCCLAPGAFVSGLLCCCLRKSHRARNRFRFSVLKYVLVGFAALLVFEPFLAPSYISPPPHYQDLAQRCAVPGAAQDFQLYNGCANPHNEQIFISISLYDPRGSLAGGRWGDTLVELIHMLGPSNTFLSLYENDGSSDSSSSNNTAAAGLAKLRARLPCRHSLVNEDQTQLPLESFPNITMPDGTVRHKRVAYLSEIRNRALRPLDVASAAGGVDGVRFDKVLFLNDIAFRALDAAQLLFSTNVDHDSMRTQYLAACALDWKRPFTFYDQFAQRDAEGYANGLPFFPIFSRQGHGLSRAAMLAQSDAVPVQSCWGGMVAMQAQYLQNQNAALPRADFQDTGSHVVNPAYPSTAVSARGPVRFRHEPELFYDACECCLFCADVSQAAARAHAPLEQSQIYVNPYVRVTYGFWRLPMVRLLQRWERLFVVPQTILSPLLGSPLNNPYRAVQPGDKFAEEVWDLAANQWTMKTRKGRSGLFCGVREMQLLKEGPRTGDRNWERAKIPGGQYLDFPS